jgi:hypothetical protein
VLHIYAFQSTKCILDSHVFFKQSSQFEWSERNVPNPIIDFFKANVFTDTDGGDVYPSFTPSYSAISTNVAHFEAIGLLEGRKFGGHCTRSPKDFGSEGLPQSSGG